MLRRPWILALVVIAGSWGCSLAIEPRLYKPSPMVDAGASTLDAGLADAGLGDSDEGGSDTGAGDATTGDATVADAVIVPTDAPSRSDASDVAITGRDVVADANPSLPTCSNDSMCPTGSLCCARLGRCLPERVMDVLCAPDLLDCPRVACGPGQLCCDGVLPARCVSLETYLNVCPNRACLDRFAPPFSCPATGVGGGRLECCNNRCVNVANNVNHCGRCGNSCGSGLVCGSGACETCLHSTADDPNYADLRCCRSPTDADCVRGRPCCAPLPPL